MSDAEVPVFFYGLFMDETLLASKEVRATRIGIGYADAFELRIGERATLVSCPGARAWGVLMKVPKDQLCALYAGPGVADYVAETIAVTVPGSTPVSARCYNLPADKLAGANPRYAVALLELAVALDFPEGYREHIQGFA